ncbi:MAG: 2,4-dihydroxyhept-2-ene-1,7-dioic acid aldolase, partial [Chloroflexi bacterium]|nr:2,4-dihydroxyhept-2-ene-1,7-dioic acid aldolase [Chloroflexota bacterium]
RVPWNDPASIKRALDAGAYGVVVPMVNTAEDAVRAVRACRYPPQGDRRVGGVSPRLFGGADYLARANDELLLVIQIEHVEAVRHAREILSVPGVDAYLIGPNDLSASLGFPPSYDTDAPSYREALETVLRVGKELGVPAGIHVSSAEVALRRIEQGYQFVSIASDTAFMAAAAGSAVGKLREGLRR